MLVFVYNVSVRFNDILVIFSSSLFYSRAREPNLEAAALGKPSSSI